jgi:predicted PurR-regulated permease PerM
MNNRPITYDLPWYIKAAAVLLMLTLTIYGMIVAKTVIVPFLFALFFAVLLSPLCGKLESWRFPRVLAALSSLLLGISVVALGVMFFYSQLAGFVDDSDQIQQRVSDLFNEFYALVGPYVDADPEQYLENIEASIIEFIRGNFDSLSKGVMTAATTITMVFIVPVYVVLLLIFRGFLKEFLVRAFSNGDSDKVGRLINKVKSVVQHYILGMLIVICILAVLNSTLLLILGVKHAIFFGVFAAFLNIIPFVGPLVGSILPILYALLTTDSLLIPALVLLGFYIIQLFESNLFTPAIVGRQVSLNPLVTLLAIFIGAQIWGLVGMILFIPFGAVLKVIFDEVDSLKPLGFLLGKADLQQKGVNPLAQKVREISNKIQKKDSTESGNEAAKEKQEKPRKVLKKDDRKRK